tara:strand:- start:370 stop:1128 length:759 start_codon:yes stop_codon:yes gene_type:complete
MKNIIYILFYLLINVNALIKPLTFTNVNEFQTRNRYKKIITISPGGLAGFYILGTIAYIKEHYDLSEYHFLGASAGAWNSLPMTYKKPMDTIVYDIINNYNNEEITSIYELQCKLKSILIENYDINDFELNKINIATTTFTKSGFQQKIISNINTLEQATDSCFASSYIPFITGKGFQKINGKILFDGGFKKFPPSEIKSHFDINPYMWKKEITEQFYDLLNINNIKNSEKMFENGYYDSEKNKDILDKYFL